MHVHWVNGVSKINLLWLYSCPLVSVSIFLFLLFSLARKDGVPPHVEKNLAGVGISLLVALNIKKRHTLGYKWVLNLVENISFTYSKGLCVHNYY